MKKIFLVLLALMMVNTLILTGCESSPTTTGSPATSPATAPATAPATTTPVAAGPKTGGTLRMGDLMVPPGSIGWPSDPPFTMGCQIIPLTFESLVITDTSGAMKPKLATEWEIAPDLKSITLKLRQGVKFHDGSEFNADVAKWNIDQMIAAKISLLASFVSVDVVDPSTIRINLTQYNNTVPNGLINTFMVSKAAYDKNGLDWMKQNPVGTGPFKFVSYEPGVTLKTARFDDYWDGKPYLDAIEMKYIIDPMTRAAAFERGEVDIVTSDAGKTEGDLVNKGYPYLSTIGGTFSLVPDSKNASSPLSSLKVRQAIDYAINREAITKNLGYGFWKPTYQYSVPGSASYIDNLEGRKYDPEKAKQLLAEAGYADKEIKISLYADQKAGEDVLVAIQGYLSQVGITADINMVDAGVYRDYMLKGWTNGFVSSAFSTERNLNISLNFIWTKASPFVAGMQKPDEMEALAAAAAATKEREPAVMQKVTQYIFDTAMFIPLFTAERASIMKPYVHDTGFYSQEWFHGWEPAKAWIDK